MRRLLLLPLAVLAVGGGIAVAALDGSSVPGVPSPAGALETARDGGRAAKARIERERAPLRHVTCPADLSGCRTAEGRVIFVESDDPDGDGDLHVVLLDGGSITGPGITAVDVAPALRPSQDPRVGDRAGAAGQVQTGSHGQSQIHAARFAVAGVS